MRVKPCNPTSWWTVADKARARIDALVDNELPQSDPALSKFLALAAERDRIGREKYGRPLTLNNGRDQMADALDEALDLCVYLQNVADECGTLKARMLADEARAFAVRLVGYSMEAGK